MLSFFLSTDMFINVTYNKDSNNIKTVY